MHQLDANFRLKREAAQRNRAATRRRRLFVVAGIGVFVILAGVGASLHFDLIGIEPAPPPGSKDMQAGTKPPQSRPVFANAIVDIAGDPLIIRLGSGDDADRKLHEILRPADLNLQNIPASLGILSDTMLSTSQRIEPLPSTPEDFAFFQSQSARGAEPVAASADAEAPTEEPDAAVADDPSVDDADMDEVLVPVAGQDDLESGGALSMEDDSGSSEGVVLEPVDTGMIGDPGSDEDAGWDQAVGQVAEKLPTAKPTTIDDTTTVAMVKRESDRFPVMEDFTIAVKGARDLESIAAEYGFSSEDAEKAAAAAKRYFKIETIAEGSIVMMRGVRPGEKPTGYALAQVSIRGPGGDYVGTIALGSQGDFVAGAEPVFDVDMSHLGEDRGASDPLSYRLLDAIYSTAMRNKVPGGVTGEAIMLMSRSFDLQATASKDDRLVLIFADAPRDPARNAGRLLYAAVQGPGRNLECFVYQQAPGGEFSCMSEKDDTHAVVVSNGMVNPVSGVMTSTFGPRLHPILGKVRMHKGVDWAAPIGTPVMAAFAGSIQFAGDGHGYGNVIRIDHGGGKVTAYAHLSNFEPGIAVGVAVTAGEIIGHVGTTGLSTGPHLHFEVYMNGVAIDPLATAVAIAVEETDSDNAAVERLVNRIIHVESAGNARAKNTRSSASGLGQFIKSTWIRMMKTYRPDLFQSMTTEQLLELRFNPTISREMVQHLARENEARLKAHGHPITAGRLYLAHFLGPEGAHIALAAPPGAGLADILGQQVIGANPFLTGKTASYVIAWAEKKMGGRAPPTVVAEADPGVSTKEIVKSSPEFTRFREAIARLVSTGGTQL